MSDIVDEYMNCLPEGEKYIKMIYVPSYDVGYDKIEYNVKMREVDKYGNAVSEKYWGGTSFSGSFLEEMPLEAVSGEVQSAIQQSLHDFIMKELVVNDNKSN